MTEEIPEVILRRGGGKFVLVQSERTGRYHLYEDGNCNSHRGVYDSFLKYVAFGEDEEESFGKLSREEKLERLDKRSTLRNQSALYGGWFDQAFGDFFWKGGGFIFQDDQRKVLRASGKSADGKFDVAVARELLKRYARENLPEYSVEISEDEGFD